VNDNCNVFSAGLASAWDWSEFSVALWVRMNAASVWSDGANRNWVVLSGGNNYLWLRKISTANMIQVCAQYNGTGRYGDLLGDGAVAQLGCLDGGDNRVGFQLSPRLAGARGAVGL